MRKLLLAVSLIFCAAIPAAAWRIPSIDVAIDVQRDSSVIVTETIVADFTDDPHHGIYRDIPLTTKDRYGNKRRLRLEVLGVTDENGHDLTRKIEPSFNNMRVKIGDADTLVEGIKTYVIRYRVVRAVGFFDEGDEIYWNAIGSEWQVPVEKASCIVTLLASVPSGALHATSFTGYYGSTTSDAGIAMVGNNAVRFQMNRALSPGESMTIVAGWPKNIVTKPPIGQRIIWFVTDNGYFFLPPVFFLFLFWLWRRAGRDPYTGKSETVMYDPPDDLRPAELGTIIDERVDMKDIAASIVDLAVRGYMTIKANVEPGLFHSKVDYKLQLRTPYAQMYSEEALTPFERNLIEAIFDGDDTRLMSSLKNRFYLHLDGLKDALYNAMVTRGYFNSRPDSVRTSYMVGGFAIAGLCILLLFFFSAIINIPIGWFLAAAVCGLALAAVSRTMPKKTKSGKNALVGARGFEEYLSRAEKGMIQMQEREGYFEKFLPYAMAFGIADKWAQAFEGLDIKHPDWYVGDGGIFRPAIFAHDLTNASQGWGGVMTSQPRSSGSGGGGFGGGSGFSGGSSGGGGGGGGGGAW
ncbi:MAG: DUF2207 domain-containing protein [Armatimonadota bacterium]|nr:DUF2207 domain-containing protein [Armatimonadota bacterium]